jgi:O-antigen ligase
VNSERHRLPWRLSNGRTAARMGLIVGVQLVLLGGFALDWRVPLVIAVGGVGGMLLLDRPVAATCVLIAARLVSTGTTSLLTVGPMRIGLFEPILGIALLALLARVVLHRAPLRLGLPWRPIHLAMIGWNVLGLAWCARISDGIGDIVGLGVVLATSTILVTFLDRWEHLRAALWTWIATCVAIGLLAVGGDAIGLADYGAQWQASAAGGRETGLGQQPNWFAMNLGFVIPATVAFAWIQTRAVARWGLFAAAAFITVAMMTSGSRGGAYSLLIGCGLMALGQPRLRSWALRLAGVGAAVFALAALGGLGDAGRGLNRITMNLGVLFARDIRGMNWAACIAMARDTWGLGIGPGGYVDHLQRYNDWLYHSVYRYPHGIPWGQLAHGGVVGLGLWLAMIVGVARMSLQTVRDVRGTEAEPLAWAMPASLAGYAAWSCVEFNLDDKPAWEWLALTTALHAIGRAARDGRHPPLPAPRSSP